MKDILVFSINDSNIYTAISTSVQVQNIGLRMQKHWSSKIFLSKQKKKKKVSEERNQRKLLE